MAESRDTIGRYGGSDGDEFDRSGVHCMLLPALKSARRATYALMSGKNTPVSSGDTMCSSPLFQTP
jgi:hypothetical protein